LLPFLAAAAHNCSAAAAAAAGGCAGQNGGWEWEGGSGFGGSQEQLFISYVERKESKKLTDTKLISRKSRKHGN
jgi:hypothetical protein